MLGTSRRAERFARALDGEPVDDPATRGLVAVAGRLSALQVAAPSRAGSTARAAIVGAAGVALAETARHAATTGGRAAAHQGFLHALAHSAALPLATGLAAVTVGAGAVGVAAHRSVPGDPFYGVKRTGESLRLQLATGSTDRADLRLALARTRLHEIEQLWPAATGSGAPSDAHAAQIASLVTSLDHDVALATGPLLAAGGTAAARLATDVTALRTTLAALPHTVTGEGATAVRTSIGLLGSLSASVGALPVLVPGTGRTAVAPTHGVQVAPSSSGPTVHPTAPASVVATAPSATRATAPSVGSSAPAADSSLPSSLPTMTLPPVAPSAVPSAVSSAVCGLLGVVGTACPTGS